MTKRAYDEWYPRRKLNESGWDVSKPDSVKFNSGSETCRHAVAKMIAAYYLKQEGYRISSEVRHPDRGEIDILAYSPERVIAVELETSPTEDVIRDKVDRYVHGPIQDCFVLNVGQMPENILDALEWVDNQL